jgi:hypothetical protein
LSPKPKGSFLGAAKRLAVWCGVGTAVFGFVLQGVAVAELLWSHAKAEQRSEDRLTAVETAVSGMRTDITNLTHSFDTWKGAIQGPDGVQVRSAAQAANK